MSYFTDDLCISYYGKIDKKSHWMVRHEFVFHINETDYVLIPDTFITDGASVPRPFWSLLPPWNDYGQAAVLHDYLIGVGIVRSTNGDYRVNRHEARSIFNQAMKASDVSSFKRSLIRNAVKVYDHYIGFVNKLLKRSV